ncbi:MAG: sulfite exporter TauE/SafE family protein, partial [Syntrophales bacterium]|nr:sulfite exporter TauE/SafE family protein [Syntrophales bacterium]
DVYKRQAMSTTIVMVCGLGVLSVASGMLGLGVAFAAVPFLAFFLPDLVHQVQPLSLLLNGITALFAVFGFAQSGYVDWRKAATLAVVTTLSAPFGAWLVLYTPVVYVWIAYLLSVIYLAYRLFRPVQARPGAERFPLALVLAVPISILSGLLGVGPGFLLMPTLILVGFDPKKAAGINAFAVMPPSFSALIPHLATARFDVGLTVALLVVGAVGSFLGARLTSLYVPSGRIRQGFGVLIVIMTAYRIYTLLV